MIICISGCDSNYEGGFGLNGSGNEIKVVMGLDNENGNGLVVIVLYKILIVIV